MKEAHAKGGAGSAPRAPPEEGKEGWCSTLLPLSLPVASNARWSMESWGSPACVQNPLENTTVGTVLQHGQPRPAQGRDTLFRAVRDMTESPWGHNCPWGTLAWQVGVGCGALTALPCLQLLFL